MSRYAVLRFAAAVLFSGALIFTDLYLNTFDRLRGELSQLLTPFRYTAELPERMVTTARDYLKFRSTLLEEKKTLEEQLLRQTVRISSLDFFSASNNELRALLGMPLRREGKWLAADVRPETSQLRRDKIYLNRGIIDGVAPGMSVVDEKGVVGQIVQADANSSVVNLISNDRQWIAARVQRTGRLAIVRGAGLGVMEIDSMPGNADLQPGDNLTADGGVYPAGYPVGKVIEVSRGVRYLVAVLEPASNFYGRRALLIYTGDKLE